MNIRAAKEAITLSLDTAKAGVSKSIEALELIDNLPLGVFLFSKTSNHYRCQLANQWFENLVEVHRPLIFGAKLSDLLPTESIEILNEKLQHCTDKRRQVDFEWEMGSGPVKKYLSCHLIPIEDHIDQTIKVLGVVSDHSSVRLAERQILHNAMHDTLTSLPNRILFQDKIEQQLHNQDEGETKHSAIVLLNVDRFQLINESLGHISGDELLIALASRLNNTTSLGDTLSRLGSDEFAIFLSRISDPKDAQDLADAIHRALTPPFKIANQDIYITVSIGIATTNTSNAHAEDLLRDADFAMHRAKMAGKARTEVYISELHSNAQHRFKLEADLRHAIDLEQLKLFYQPIIDLRTGQLEGFEALARWPHPEKGQISPAEFIPIAEETGLIIPLGRWVLKQACSDLNEWKTSFGTTCKSLNVSVNLSSIQLARDNCEAVVSHLLEKFQIAGPSLRLELTETAIVENPDLALDVLQKLKTLDVQLALDDFGTGYSSLSYLHKLPFDTLKIDRSFIQGIGNKEEGFAIVETITTLGRSLKMSLVAEGIETKEQLALLKQLGCEFGQGFLFARPMCKEDATQLIQQELGCDTDSNDV